MQRSLYVSSRMRALFWLVLMFSNALFPVASASEAWTQEKVLVAERTEFAAVSLAGGDALIAGGRNSQGIPTASAARYSKGVWAAVGSMSAPRRGHVMIGLPDGRVLAIGGRDLDAQPLASVEVFVPSTNEWQPFGSLQRARRDHSAVLLASGAVLVAGGFDQDIETAPSEILLPGSSVWTLTASQSAQRRQRPILIPLPDGDALILGGNTGASVLASVERYNSVTGQWLVQPSMNIGRDFFAAFLLRDGRVMAVGGFSGGQYIESHEVRDASTGIWSIGVGPSPLGELLQVAQLSDGRHLLTGAGESYTLAWILNPGDTVWQPLPSLNQGRLLHRSVAVPGRLLVIGGTSATGYATTVETWVGIHFSSFE